MRRITKSTGLKKGILVLGVMAGVMLTAVPVNAVATVGAGVGALPGDALSSDATLRALRVEPGSMSPAFSPAVTEYTITIGEDVTDITVSGGVADENARITTASGFKNLGEADSQAQITVTAEDGSTLTYHFAITRGSQDGAPDAPQGEQENGQADMMQPADTAAEQPKTPETLEAPETPKAQTGENGAQTVVSPYAFQLDGVDYQVLAGFDSGLLPDGCLKQDITFQGQTVEGAYFEAGQMMLVYAVSKKDGTGDFYIYDEKSGVSSLFIQIKTGNNNFIVPVKTQEKAPAGFSEKNMQWNNTYLFAYQATNSSVSGAKDFYLFYAVDQNGTYGYYLYDAVQGTCQRFLAYASSVSDGILFGINVTVIIGMMAIVMTGMLLIIFSLALKNREIAADKKTEKKEKNKYTVLTEGGKTEQEATTAAPAAEETAAPDVTVKAEKEQAQQAAEKKSAGQMPIEITDVEDADDYNRSLQQKALAEEKREAQRKAARKAALEREIAKDEKARAKREAAEKRKQQDVQRQVLAEKKAKEKLEQAERVHRQKAEDEKTENPESGMRTIVKKEVTERGVTYTTGKIPITVVSPGKSAKKRNPVPIYTLEKRTVSLTREPGPDELDDDFEFEFIHIDRD